MHIKEQDATRNSEADRVFDLPCCEIVTVPAVLANDNVAAVKLGEAALVETLDLHWAVLVLVWHQIRREILDPTLEHTSQWLGQSVDVGLYLLGDIAASCGNDVHAHVSFDFAAQILELFDRLLGQQRVAVRHGVDILVPLKKIEGIISVVVLACCMTGLCLDALAAEHGMLQNLAMQVLRQHGVRAASSSCSFLYLR